jgi:hypothetical protein
VNRQAAEVRDFPERIIIADSRAIALKNRLGPFAVAQLRNCDLVRPYSTSQIDAAEYEKSYSWWSEFPHTLGDNPMRRVVPFAVGALMLAWALPAAARAIAIQNRTPAQQAMQAEVIVAGKVSEIEKEMSKATQFPGAQEKVDYHVGVIKIADNIAGAKGLTTIRVGFLPAPKGDPGPVGGPIRRPPFRQPQATLSDGQEGVFFLTKHHDGDFYIMQQFGLPLDKKAADYDKQLETVKRIIKIVEDPAAALKVKDAAERQFAAVLLVQKYRTYPQNAGNKQPKQEEIPADQSKQILQAMAEMEWNKFEQKEGFPVSVQNMFGMLGIQPGQHGFDPPKFQPGQNDYAEVYAKYVKGWLNDNAEKYRIQKWVAVE